MTDPKSFLQMQAPPAPSDVSGAPGIPATRRSLNAARTRQDLLVAARDLFVERGYDATSVEDITAGALASKGTFYNHFADKCAAFAELFRARIEVASQILVSALESLEVTDPPGGLLVAHGAIADYLQAAVQDREHRELLRQAPGVLGHEGYRSIDEEVALAKLMDLIRALVSRGELHPDAARPIAAKFVLTCLCESTLHIAAASDREEAFSDALGALARMLGGYATVAPFEHRVRATDG